MTLKDFSFDLGPSDTDGLSIMVERLQVDQLEKTREHFSGEPYLRGHLRPRHGWIDMWPKWICARMLSVSFGPGMDEDDALKKIHGPIEDKLKRLACRNLPVLEFDGKPCKDFELGRPVWKIKSKPAVWISELRTEIRALAERLNFKVQGLIEPENEVHIVIRGRYPNSGIDPPLPPDQSGFHMTFHKLGFRRRFEYGTGSSEPFGATLSVNFGTAIHVTSGGSMPMEFLSDISDDREFPSLSMLGPPRPNRPNISNVDMCAGTLPAWPRIVELHESTEFPLDSDFEVAVAASLRVADLEVAPRNAHVCEGVARGRWFPEPFVLLKVSRDPREYHEELESCPELQKCREDLEAAGKSFLLLSRAKAFVHPGQYDAAMTAVEFSGLRLIPQHVLVSQDHEASVRNVIQRISCNSKVRVQRKTRIPSGLASEAASVGMNIEVHGTFIHVNVPSSLRSSVTGQHCVASTTEAHNAKNPRRA